MLFHSDEKKAKALKPQSRAKRYIKRAIKIIIVLAVLFWISISILGALGSNHNALRLGVEDYLGRSTGMVAKVGRFDYMGFYPNISLDIGELTLTPKGQGKPEVSIESFKFSMRFWDMFFSRRQFNILDAKNIKIEKNIVTVGALSFDHIGVGKDDVLEAVGTYASKPLRATLHLNRFVDKKGTVFYKRSDKNAFIIDSSLIKAKGHLGHGKGGGLLFDFETLGFSDAVFSGPLTLKVDQGIYTINADLKTESSHIQGTVKIDQHVVKGEIHAPEFSLEDWDKYKPIWAAKRAIFIAGATTDSGYLPAGTSLDLDITIDNLLSGGKSMGAVEAPLVMEGGVLTLGPLDGTIYGGGLEGSFVLDGTKESAHLDLKGRIKDLTYDRLVTMLFGGGQAKGTMTITARLVSDGATSDALYKNLSGDIIAISGEGEFPTKMIDLWGGGLINALVPRLGAETPMGQTCFIANFDVKNGKGEAQPLFLDTNRVTVYGKGHINLVDETIDLVLTPKAKDPVLLDLATPVRLRGSLYNRQIKPDRLAIGYKIGELALAVINPAFLAYSLTDLGLNDQHPCRPYLKAEEQ